MTHYTVQSKDTSSPLPNPPFTNHEFPVPNSTNLPHSRPPIRILLIADTHLGFDLPLEPRVNRRRRGPDFFRNLNLALEPARTGQVQLVVHGGDLLYRSKVPPALVERALEPLIGIARLGVPVFVVPGNHERSRIPLNLWTSHPLLHIFDRPRTFFQEVKGYRVALAGFPFKREIRNTFRDTMNATGITTCEADVRLLCLHQAIEGAQVGPSNYTFRQGVDIIPGQDLPREVSVVLAGHIHRAQILRRDLSGKVLPAPVVYPGSIDRTSFAERDEGKGAFLVTLVPDAATWWRPQFRWMSLPTRPMMALEIPVRRWDPDAFIESLRVELGSLDPDAIVRIRLSGPQASIARAHLSASILRSLAPTTMNVDIAPDHYHKRKKQT